MKKYDIGSDFEGILDSRMRDMGITILAREPETELPDGKTPDFLVEYGGLKCYVEALALESDLVKTDAEDDLVASLNAHKSTDFFLLICAKPPNRLQRRLRRDTVLPIIEWMNSQDVEAIPDKPRLDLNSLPKKEFDLNGYRLKATLIPVSREYRTEQFAQERDLVGGQMLTSTTRSIGDTARERVRQKCKRYTSRNLGGIPLVVAINDFLFIHMVAELYGTPVTTVYSNRNTGEFVGAVNSILHDGIWHRVEKGQPVLQAQHLLAVWHFTYAHANNPDAQNCLYTNPFVDVPSKLPAPFFYGQHTQFPDGKLEYHDGSST